MFENFVTKDKDIEEKNFSGVKLTVTCTNVLHSGNAALTSSCRVELFHEGSVAKFYIVRIGTRTQQKKYESFNKFYEKNKSSWRTSSVELFNPDITLDKFEKFVELINTQKGSNLEKGYCPLTTNCAATVSQTIRYFINDNYPRKTYWAIKSGFSVFFYIKGLIFTRTFPVDDGIRLAIFLLGGPYFLGYIAPGFVPIQAPPFFNSLNDVLIEAETYAIWYGKPLVDRRGAFPLIEKIAGNRLALNAVAKTLVEILGSPVNPKDFVSAGFITKFFCDGFRDFLKSRGYSEREILAMEPAFQCAVALYFLFSGSPMLGLLFMGLAIPKKSAVAGIICISAGMAYMYGGFNSLLQTQLGVACAVPMYHCAIKPMVNRVIYPLAKATDNEVKELVSMVTPGTDLLADVVGSAVKRVGDTAVGGVMHKAATRVVGVCKETAVSLSKNSFFVKVCSPAAPVTLSMRKLASAACQIAGNTYTGSALASMANSAQSRFWNKINSHNPSRAERSSSNRPILRLA